jgi:hypothetical protein
LSRFFILKILWISCDLAGEYLNLSPLCSGLYFGEKDFFIPLSNNNIYLILGKFYHFCPSFQHFKEILLPPLNKDVKIYT